MQTAELLAALRLCKGAVESASIYPIFSHFCFEETVVYTFNDVCAIVVPFESGLEMGLRAEILLGVLPTLGKELTISKGKDAASMVLKSGGSELKLPSLPKSSFMFEPPHVKTQLTIHPTSEFFSGLDKCSRTVGSNALARAFTGVAFEFAKGALTLYSSDDVRLSRYVMPDEVGLQPANGVQGGRWLLPERACGLLSEAWAATPDDVPTTISLSKEWLHFESSAVDVYSKLMPEQPPNYAETVKSLGGKGWTWQEMPSSFKGMVTRAEVLTSKDPSAGVKLTTDGKTISATLDAGMSMAMGNFNDKIKLTEALEPMALAFNTNKLSEALDSAKEFALTENCMAVRNGSYTCWISPTQTSAGE